MVLTYHNNLISLIIFNCRHMLACCIMRQCLIPQYRSTRDFYYYPFSIYDLRTSNQESPNARRQTVSGPKTRKNVKTVNIRRSSFVISHFFVHWFLSALAILMTREQFPDSQFGPSKILFGDY